jgi:hypothetical protein
MVTGFLTKGNVLGRPCDIMKLDANSFLFTDDNRGVIYLVRRKGTTPVVSSAISNDTVEPLAQDSPGQSSTSLRYCFSIALLFAAAVMRTFI